MPGGVLENFGLGNLEIAFSKKCLSIISNVALEEISQFPNPQFQNFLYLLSENHSLIRHLSKQTILNALKQLLWKSSCLFFKEG